MRGDTRMLLIGNYKEIARLLTMSKHFTFITFFKSGDVFFSDENNVMHIRTFLQVFKPFTLDKHQAKALHRYVKVAGKSYNDLYGEPDDFTNMSVTCSNEYIRVNGRFEMTATSQYRAVEERDEMVFEKYLTMFQDTKDMKQCVRFMYDDLQRIFRAVISNNRDKSQVYHEVVDELYFERDMNFVLKYPHNLKETVLFLGDMQKWQASFNHFVLHRNMIRRLYYFSLNWNLPFVDIYFTDDYLLVESNVDGDIQYRERFDKKNASYDILL